MPTDFFALATAVAQDVIAWRRRFHAYPEPAFQERETAAFVAETLREFGYSPRSVGETGVAATLEGGGPGMVIGLRADMDALTVTETTDLSFASRKPGLMHACGHDAHTAILLGAAKILAGYRGTFPGGIKFFFQPAEEPLAGARMFTAAGELDDVDALAALHVMPNLDTGVIGARSGVMMAASDTFSITVSGKAAHGAEPHHGIDAILAASHIVTALQSFVSRNVGPLDSAVITIGKIRGGTAFNAIAEKVVLEGTLRTLKTEIREKAFARIRSIIDHTTAMFGGEATMTVANGSPPLVNDPGWVERLRNAALRYVPEENFRSIAEPSMGGEDFALMLEKAPGVFWNLGVRAPGAKQTFLHSGAFMLDENALALGVAVTCTLAMDALTKPR